LYSSSESGSDGESDDFANKGAGWSRKSSGFDSGYGSSKEDADEKARYYDELLEQFRAEGPILAKHARNMMKMEEEQEAKWEEYDAWRSLLTIRG
jgi:hypothetical protein